MSLWLERFGSLELPLIEAEQDIGAIGTRTQYFNLPGGGAYDAYGDDVAPRGMYRLSATGEIGNLTTAAEMQVQFDALRAMRGRRNKLYARMDDTTVRWVWARLANIPIRRGMDNVLYLLASLSFDVLSPIWYGDRHGDGWFLDDGEDIDTGLALDEDDGDVFPLTATTLAAVENRGTAAVENVVLSFTADPAIDITGLEILTAELTDDAAHIFFTGTIGAGQTMVLDTGAQSATIATFLTASADTPDTTLNVDNSDEWVVGYSVEIELENGRIHRTTIASVPDAISITIDDPMPSLALTNRPVVMSVYPDISFGVNHRLTSWLRLLPAAGSTLITVYADGGGTGSLLVSFSEGWE